MEISLLLLKKNCISTARNLLVNWCHIRAIASHWYHQMPLADFLGLLWDTFWGVTLAPTLWGSEEINGRSVNRNVWLFYSRWAEYPVQSEPLWDGGNRVLLSTMARCHFFLPLRKRENQQFWLPFPWIHNKHVMALSYPLALRQGCIPVFCFLVPV